LPETLIRIGVGRNLEARVGVPNYAQIRNGGRVCGWDDLYLGAKIQLGPLGDGTGAALIPGAFVPAGDRMLRREETEPEIAFVWSRDLPQDRSLGGMLRASRVRSDGKWSTAWAHTIALGMPIGGTFGAFIELASDFASGEQTEHLFHAGFTHQPRSDKQFDLHLGFGLTSGAPDFFVGVGWSARR